MKEQKFVIECPCNGYAFSLEQTLQCGQCFRWQRAGDENAYFSVVGDKYVEVSQRENTLFLRAENDGENDSDFWRHYFDLERDYHSLHKILSRDPTLAAAMDFCGGIRVLNQPHWETLCSYIISQNNNIPRIKSLIEKMCAKFGSPVKEFPAGEKMFSFPAPEILARASLEDFEKMGFGYRAPFVLETARAVDSGNFSLDALVEMSADEGLVELKKLKGVGDKVAKCTLLYGFGKIEAFPVDTWIKKSLLNYPEGLPDFVMPHAGIAQIYLFHYERKLQSQK